jgi:hypothetical protein
MAKRKYNLIDDNGEVVGFVVVEQPAPLEHTAPGLVVGSGPAADAALFATVLIGFTGAAWLLPGPDWIAPALGITITASLAGLKAWRSGPAPAGPGPDRSGTVTIQVETWPEHGPVLLDEIQDKSIALADWRKVARAVAVDGVNFSRPALARYVSQSTWHKIKAELVRLHMAHKQGNGYILSPRGVKLFKKIHALP